MDLFLTLSRDHSTKCLFFMGQLCHICLSVFIFLENTRVQHDPTISKDTDFKIKVSLKVCQGC